MSVEKQFQAAVQVIQGLPKDGPYQPSHEMMLKFYGFYKQSTEGDCNLGKPNFWEVIKKAKYDAWVKLKGMPKEEAMEHYVEELKKIVETMSYSTEVATFMEVLGPFYEYVAEDLEGRDSREASDSGIDMNKPFSDDDKAVLHSIGSYLEAKVDIKNENVSPTPSLTKVISSSDDEDEFKDAEDDSSVDSSLRQAVVQLNADLASLRERISLLEQTTPSLPKPVGSSTKSFIFWIVWPFAAQALMSALTNWHKNR